MIKEAKVSKPILVASLSLAFLFLLNSVAVAIVRPIHLETRYGQVRSQTATSSAGKGNKLDQVKLKVCQKKQAAIKKRSQNLVRRANLIMSRFDRITAKVKEYYTNRLVPKGVTIENYDQMIANTDNNKESAKTALAKAGSTADEFSCGMNDPKAHLQTFRQDMSAVINALKEYKKSVINFLVAVRTKAKNIKTTTATGSATPSAAP